MTDQPPPLEPRTHDYSGLRRGWGHDYTFSPVDGGRGGRMSGWGGGIRLGDFLLLRNGDRQTRYRVASISYHADPPDMWQADVEFAPRQAEPSTA